MRELFDVLAAPSWHACALVKGIFDSPITFLEYYAHGRSGMDPATKTGGQAPLDKELFATPDSLKKAVVLGTSIALFDHAFAKVVKGTLAQPSSGGIVVTDILEICFGEDWRALSAAIEQDKTGGAKQDKQKELAGKGNEEGDDKQTLPGIETGDQPKSIDQRDILKLRAKEVAVSMMQSNLCILTPGNWSESALSTICQTQAIAQRADPQRQGPQCHVTFLAFFFCDCDDEARVTHGQNWVARHPSVEKDRLLEFCRAVGQVMDGADVCCIKVGRVIENESVVLEVIKAMKWGRRRIILSYDESALAGLMVAAQAKRKRGRVHRSAKFKLVEAVVVGCIKIEIICYCSKKRGHVIKVSIFQYK